MPARYGEGGGEAGTQLIKLHFSRASMMLTWVDLGQNLSCRGLMALTLSQTASRLEWNLSYTLYLMLSLCFSKALCGCTVNVPTLDGRTIPIVFKDVIRPGMRRKVPGEGLPLPKTPEKRGDLVIEFEVIFPERIPQTSRTILEQVLPK